MKRKIKLLGRKKLILSLYDQLEQKENEIKNINDYYQNLKNENDQLKNDLVVYKSSNHIASDLNINNFLEQEIINNKSFLDYYRKIFSNLDLLSKKEYKNFVEILLFDKNDVYPRNLKNSIMKEYIRQCLNYYNLEFYQMPIYFNDDQYELLNKEINNILVANQFNAKQTIEDNKKNKVFTESLNTFNGIYNREINQINSIEDITTSQIVYYKDQILSLVSELIMFLLFDYNQSINNYYYAINKLLKDFDYAGFDNWQKTTSNPLSIKTFMKTLIKINWLNLNKKININLASFYLEYPNNYNSFLAQFGKQSAAKNEYVTKLNIISKGSIDNLILKKTNEYYSWLLTNNKTVPWNDNVFLSKDEILLILNDPNTIIMKMYGLKYNFSNSIDKDIIDIIKQENIDIKIIKLDNQYLIEKLFFYFIYISRHK